MNNEVLVEIIPNGEVILTQMDFLPRAGDTIILNFTPKSYDVIQVLFGLTSITPASQPFEPTHKSSVCIRIREKTA